jgi:hypothetical protein
MDLNIDYDALFAYRFSLQEDYDLQNEKEIILRLKYYLIDTGYTNDNIPNIIKEFYEKFGINITLEFITEALQENPLMALMNTFFQNMGIDQNNDNQEIIMNMMEKEKQYQLQLKMLGGKLNKYEEYLKTLMGKYKQLQEDRDLLKERFKNNSGNESNVNKYAMDAMEDKKRELIQLSASVQEKISKLEQLQNKQEQED